MTSYHKRNRDAGFWDWMHELKCSGIPHQFQTPAQAKAYSLLSKQSVDFWSKVNCPDPTFLAINRAYQRQAVMEGLDIHSQDPLVKGKLDKLYSDVFDAFGDLSMGCLSFLAEKHPRLTEDSSLSSPSFGAGGAPGLARDSRLSSPSFGAGGAPGLARDSRLSSPSFGAGGAPGLAGQRAPPAASKYRWVAKRHEETAETWVQPDERYWSRVYSPVDDCFGVAVACRNWGSIVVIIWETGLVEWAETEHFIKAVIHYVEHKGLSTKTDRDKWNRVVDMAREWVREHELIKSNPELENDPAYADGYEFVYDEQAPGEQ